jgi:hypothetical protein
MKIKALHRIIALVMAFLMFFTSVGFSVDVHYCKGELKSFSLLGEADSCHAAKKICPQHSNMLMEEDSASDCCSNETVQVEDLDTDFNLAQNAEFTDLEIEFVAAFHCAFNNISYQKNSKTSCFEIYDPLPTRDIYVLLERFLI